VDVKIAPQSCGARRQTDLAQEPDAAKRLGETSMVGEELSQGFTVPRQRRAVEGNAKDDQIACPNDHNTAQTAKVRCHAGMRHASAH
jgi:hypothetical protein